MRPAVIDNIHVSDAPDEPFELVDVELSLVDQPIGIDRHEFMSVIGVVFRFDVYHACILSQKTDIVNNKNISFPWSSSLTGINISQVDPLVKKNPLLLGDRLIDF